MIRSADMRMEQSFEVPSQVEEVVEDETSFRASDVHLAAREIVSSTTPHFFLETTAHGDAYGAVGIQHVTCLMVDLLASSQYLGPTNCSVVGTNVLQCQQF